MKHINKQSELCLRQVLNAETLAEFKECLNIRLRHLACVQIPNLIIPRISGMEQRKLISMRHEGRHTSRCRHMTCKNQLTACLLISSAVFRGVKMEKWLIRNGVLYQKKGQDAEHLA
ncbi:MAG: hypothetical protein Q7T38_12510 [Gallionella sp.]|nr:hypothetical protein [Gallionella sp.]